MDIKKQTAVDWFGKQLYDKMEMKGDGNIFDKLLEQAKAMEKESLMDCWDTSHQAGRFEGKGIAEENWQTFEQYYKETYEE